MEVKREGEQGEVLVFEVKTEAGVEILESAINHLAYYFHDEYSREANGELGACEGLIEALMILGEASGFDATMRMVEVAAKVRVKEMMEGDDDERDDD